MSQPHHELMESVAADAQAISASASPPHRNSMEDADSSLTRKRPRLDDGGKDDREMSTEPVSPTNPTASPTEKPVEMTIRSQPPSSSQPPNSARDANSQSASTPPPQEESSTTVVASIDSELPDEEDAPADSPPVIAIDDDDDPEEAMADYTGIQLECNVEEHYQRFPFTPQGGNYMQALRSVTQHFQGGNPLEATVLPQVAIWLQAFPEQPVRWRDYYLDKATFWDEFATFVNKVLIRRYQYLTSMINPDQSNDRSRYPFGDQFGVEGESEENIFATFFKAYMQLCARLLQVDADIFGKLPQDSNYEQPILSYKHIRHIHTLLRQERSPIFHVLHKEYLVDTNRMVNRIFGEFLKAKGIQHLLRFAEEACLKVSTGAKVWIAAWTTQVLDIVGWMILDLRGAKDFIDRSQYCQDVLQHFRNYHIDLQDPGKVTDTGVARDLVGYFGNLLYDLCQWNATIADELVDEFLDFGDPASPTTVSHDPETIARLGNYRHEPTFFPALVSNAWKFKVLRRFMVKGRMELRVMSITYMDTALVELWKEYNMSELSVKHPVMQYLADFLLHERVVDYIISVDSHPQLIARSGNIVGFLVVTQRYSDSQTDAIWNTVSNSTDPRVVSATMTMLRSIFHLMEAADQLYLCTKLYDLPIESYTTVDTLRFLRELTLKLQQRYVEWSITEPKARPWNVCIRVIQDTSPGKEVTGLAAALHAEACEQLRAVSLYVPQDERYQIYRECASHISTRSGKATGSVRAICILVQTAPIQDAGFFQRNLDVTRQIVQEISAFVKAETQLGSFDYQLVALQYRLELLCFLISRSSEAIPADSYQELWDHLVGKCALAKPNPHDLTKPEPRDVAWLRFSEAVKYKPDNDFCKQLISSYLPKLEPQYYSNSLYDFVACYKFPTTRRRIKTEDDENEKEVLQIRGADLLWSLILSAPPGTIELPSAQLLAARYLEIDEDEDVTLEDVEAAHVALVEQCRRELLSAHATLRCTLEDQQTGDQMDVVLSDSTRKQNELRFSRTLLFLRLLLQFIRTRPEFNRSQRSDSKVEPLESELPHGEVTEIKYQSQNGEKQSILIGLDNTLNDLHQRLCYETGYSKINLFASGHKLQIAETGPHKISSLNIGGLLLVQKAPDSEVIQPMSLPSATCSVFETTLLNHIEEFFECMDSDDYLSSELFDFLCFFPFRERIADSVMLGKGSVEDIFPPGKPFQAKYAAIALQFKLREQLRRGCLDESFLAKSIQMLVRALLNPALIGDSISGRLELHLASSLVAILLEFLKERPRPEISSTYFSDESGTAKRLLRILTVALKAENEGLTVCSTYATILEASLHCRGVWEAFISDSKVISVHQILLLADSRKLLRERISKSIKSVCGGDLPSTSPLDSAEIAARFWKILSSILPQAVDLAGQSEQLFELSEHVFRSHDEKNRDEGSLRSYLSSWSDLLLNYEHEEIVGQDEVDFVVLGFTKLLLCCIPSLKSFKKPLNAGSLIERIFQKFLFIPRVAEVDDDGSQPLPLPVLESRTRKELYDLMLALAEDRSSYDTLLRLVGTLEKSDLDVAQQSYAVDRTNEIRSHTGYVGLDNPRAICYMNSLLTQLFMNVNFRKFMLGLDLADAGNSQRLLSETQSLFAQMQNSYRKAIDVRNFAACVKTPGGGSIDINVQMDADEFYNLLFDQWEGQMLSPDTKQQFRTFYGGQTINQIKSKECEHVSERVESFFVVQCDVQGKKSLEESLAAFVEGDVMEGENKYKCESCGGRFVDAVKRTCLKDVPDNLIFHLKRFEFDLNELRRQKVNERFEFPTSIDVSPYNVEYLSDPSKPRKEDMFDLVGVLVHQGTTENGHYYSYIRIRPSEGAETWVEFNDRDVETFDIQNLAHHAFGGLVENQFQQQYKQYSAYMLFYQRRTSIEKDRREYNVSPQFCSLKVPVHPEMDKEISMDNEAFLTEYTLYDPCHSKFVRQILSTLRTVNHGTCSEDHQQETQALHILLDHLCQTMCRLRTEDNLDETLSLLRRTALSCPRCCHIVLKWFASQEYALFNLLLRCLIPKLRSSTRTLLVDSLEYLRDEDPSLYGIESVDTDMEFGNVPPVDGVLVDVIQRLRFLADELYHSTRGWEEFWLTLCRISELGHIETAALLDQGFLEFCLHVFCMHMSPQLRAAKPELWRATEKRKTIFNRMIEFVNTLLLKMEIRLPASVGNRLEHFDQSISKFPLTREEKYWLFSWHEENKAYAALDKMIELYDPHKGAIWYPGEILKWMIQIPDPQRQHLLYVTVIEGVAQLQAPYCDPYVRTALSFCEVCTSTNSIERLVDQVARNASKLREAGGDAILHFFNGLLFATNEALFEEMHPDIFYNYCLATSPKWATSLLVNDDDTVRKNAARLVHHLFLKHREDSDVLENTLKMKYRAARTLVEDMMRKIIEEYQNKTPRLLMNPMIETSQVLVQLLIDLTYPTTDTEDVYLEQIRHANDAALIQQYQTQVEELCRRWLPEEGTPISAAEAYEHSDYGSESDDGPDLVDDL